MLFNTIDSGDSRPIRQPDLLMNVNEMTRDMLGQTVIRHSQSPWASPIVLVVMMDGTTWTCVDYHHLNTVTKMDVFLMPRVDDSLYQLNHARPHLRVLAAFAAHSGLYKFVVMRFGLRNSPAMLQQLMESVQAGPTQHTYIVYINDILVMGETNAWP